MSRTKIAPVLSALVKDLWGRAKTPPPTRQKAGDAQLLRIAEAELRAVLAVVRAAKDHSHADVEYDPVSERHLCPICRALDRLARSGRGR
jgi:hypothetical protein